MPFDHVQRNLEDIHAALYPDRILLCDRGTLDGAVYWPNKSADFFAADDYPEITFASTRVEKKDDGYVLIGNLTMRGVTKEVTLPFRITGRVVDPLGQPRIGFEAQLRINRQDFGVSYDRTMDNGGLVVGNQVNIELVGEACRPAESSNPEHRRSPLFCNMP